MEAGPHVAERCAGEVGALERILARCRVIEVGREATHARRQQAQRLLRGEERRAVDARHPERLDGVRHRVPEARHRDGARKVPRQRRVVEHEHRADPFVAARTLLLLAARAAATRHGLGEAVHRRHFGARVGRRHGDHPHRHREREPLAQADRRAATEDHDGVRPGALDGRPRLGDDLDGHVLAGDREDAAAPLPEPRGQTIAIGTAAGRRDDDRPANSRNERGDLVAEARYAALAEDDSRRAAPYRKRSPHTVPLPIVCLGGPSLPSPLANR